MLAVADGLELEKLPPIGTNTRPASFENDGAKYKVEDRRCRDLEIIGYHR
jgi:hypothetical protein